MKKRTIAQTPAPNKDIIKGSTTNKIGSAKKENSYSIILSDRIIKVLQEKLNEFKEKHPNNKSITLNDLKAVYRRGSGAYSTSHRPSITRAAWSYARVNKFLEKASGNKVKKAYVQDDDLLKYEQGGVVNLAPNGKPSNLNAIQYNLVRTPAFKRWFGDWENDPKNASKVIDENGEPLVVYKKPSQEIYKDRIYNYDSKVVGISNTIRWTSNLSNLIKKYNYSTASVGNKIFIGKRKGIIIEILENYTFKILFENGNVENHGNFNAIIYENIEFLNYILFCYKLKLLITNEGDKQNIIEEINAIKLKLSDDEFIIPAFLNIRIMGDSDKALSHSHAMLKDSGYKIDDDYFVNWSRQIKIAIGSNRTFDPYNPDIRYKKGGKIKGLIERADGSYSNGGVVENEFYYIPSEESKKIIEDFTHYKVGDNIYPKKIWADWFVSQDRKSKEFIAKEIESNNDLKNALLSNWYDDYKKNNNSNLSYQDFLNNDIEVYRGLTSRDAKFGVAYGFDSYTPDIRLAKHFAADDSGTIDIKIVKPKNTYGLIESIDAEREVLIPTKYSNEFLKNEYENLLNNNGYIFDKMTDENESVIIKYEKDENYNDAIKFIKELIQKTPKTYNEGGILDNKIFWGRVGAGILPICKKTKRILLNYRSSFVNEPNTYGIYGGKLDNEVENTEGIISAAKREMLEETGYEGEMEIIPSYVYKFKDKFTYYNFIGLIDDEFMPNLDWESEGYVWLTFDELIEIEPKHFGLKELIDNDLQTIKKYTLGNELYNFKHGGKLKNYSMDYFKKTKSLENIAEKFNVSFNYAKKQLHKGMRIESEHTEHERIQKIIALQHLEEDINYYGTKENQKKQFWYKGLFN